MGKMLQLRLLGRPEISLGDISLVESLSTKTQAILYYLAVTGQPQPRPALATLLWGDVPDDAARTNLRKALANLRQGLGDYLDLDGQVIAFKSTPWLDVAEFQGTCVKYQAPVARYQVPGTEYQGDFSPDTLRKAVELYRGDFLSGYYVRHAPDFENWMLAEQARLRELVIQALQTLTAAYAEQGEVAQGILSVRRLLSLEPWREEAHRQLMLLLAQDDQRSAALAQYEICRRVLADELGVEPGPETRTLYQRIREGKLDPVIWWQGDRVTTGLPAPHRVTPAQPPRHNLPPQPTAFVGREKELADIIRRLTDKDCRLLTLVGPGGIGKTRLALQTAQIMLDSEAAGDFFEHGLFFIPLAAVNSPGGIAPAIAAAANFNFSGSVPPQQQLLGFLQGKKMLLILDNLEHLLFSPAGGDESNRYLSDSPVSGAELIAEILAAAPQVKILVTSREALNLQEAWFHPIEGLSFPTSPLTPEGQPVSLESYDAVRLFIQSAQRARVQFSLAAEQAQVVRLCQLVEGMPLALELAAAWLKVMPTEKIVQEIERGLDILTTRMQDIPARHRNMRAVFEHSWELLTPLERDILQRLSVFRGSFGQEAAEQVAEASLINLAILVEKSLVWVTETGRYHMHELLRQFAVEKLAYAPDQYEQFQNRHCGYYADWLDRQDAWLRTERQLSAVREISADIENIQVAWRWAVEHKQPILLRQYFWSLWFVYEAKSWFHAGAELFGGAAARLSHLEQTADPQEQQVYAQLLAFYGRFQLRLHRLERAIPLMMQSVPLLQQFNLERDLGLAYQTLGFLAWVQGHYLEARSHFDQSVTLAKRGGDALVAAYAGSLSDFMAYGLGDYRQAAQLIPQRLPVLRRLGKLWGLVFSLANLSSALSALEEYTEAEQLLLEGLTISREMGDRWAVADCLRRLGWLFTAVGEEKRGQAKQLLLEGTAIFRQIDDHWGLTTTLNQLGQTCCALGEYEASWHYLTEAIRVAQESGLTPIVLEGLVNVAELRLQAKIRLDEPAEVLELLALVLNHPAGEQATKDRAARLLAEVEPLLPAEVLTTAAIRGKSLPLEEAVTALI